MYPVALDGVHFRCDRKIAGQPHGISISESREKYYMGSKSGFRVNSVFRSRPEIVNATWVSEK